MSDVSEVAIIGAGPYGLSIAAHFRARGIDYRIFGSPMQSWRMRMPVGMLLKSEAFASNLYEPRGKFTLERFCASHGVPYQPLGFPVPLDTFTAYGLAFQRELVPDLDERMVVGLKQSKGFVLTLDDETTVSARRVIVAVGFSNFSHVPGSLAYLPAELVSHSSDDHDLSAFKGRDVTVLGGGASALDIAVSLYDHGAAVRLITRRTSLAFNAPEVPSGWKRWCPRSGLGSGWRNQFYEYGPMLFRRLPAGIRHSIVRTALGPAGGASVKDRIQKVPMLFGHSMHSASFNGARLHLKLLGPDGEECAIATDHVIAGTGFRVDVRRLSFLSKELRLHVRSREFTPVLSADFESSVPGLHFVGLAAANTFGPSMRFLLGARYTARRLVRCVERSPRT